MVVNCGVVVVENRESEMRDLEKFLKRACVRVFVYMIISAN